MGQPTSSELYSPQLKNDIQSLETMKSPDPDRWRISNRWRPTLFVLGIATVTLAVDWLLDLLR